MALMCIMKDSKVFKVSICGCSHAVDVSSSLDIPSRCELSRSLRSRSQRRRVRRPSRSVARRICSSDSTPRRDEEGSKEKNKQEENLNANNRALDVKKNDNNNLTTKSSVRISVWILSLLLLRCSVEPPMDVVVEPKL
uniref:Uncharacterized protein n=1 Tax=Glossina pallidipes TaxID=7398 RepID=A0A1A9ZAB0_GLOPL